MKYIIIIGDGMSDHPVERLGGKTLLQYADKPCMDIIARQGRTGRLISVPNGFLPGSEVANTAILGYDLNEVFEGRGPLEAAGMGYEMTADDMTLRCNTITVSNDKIINHKGGCINDDYAETLIEYLNKELGDERVNFVRGDQYRHLLVIKGGNKHIVCASPHEHIGERWHTLRVKPENGWADRHDVYTDANGNEHQRMTGQQTADILNMLIEKSHTLLSAHPLYKSGEIKANCIWPWSGGYRPKMRKLSQMYHNIKSGSVISAVDLIRGIGWYAGLDIINVEGATGLANTNYEGKAQAAIEALTRQDFVFVHVEATDEAGHDGDLETKLQAISNLDHRLISPIYNDVMKWDEPVVMAILPDHPTPVEMRIHVNEPVPFIIYHKGIEPDSVKTYDEYSVINGAYGTIDSRQFMEKLFEFSLNNS